MNWVLKKRSIWFHIIVTYFTFGIWAIVYFYYRNKYKSLQGKLNNNFFQNKLYDDVYGKDYKSTFVINLSEINSVFNKECFTWKCHEGRTLNNYVVFDVETTGLEPTNDRITEFALLKYIDNKLVDKYTELVNPNKLIPQIVVEKTGITNEMVRQKNDISLYIDKILEFIGDNIIIGHNVDFDIKFLSSEIIRSNKNYRNINIKYLDTLQLSRLLIKEVDNYRLDTLKNHLNINVESHRAANDCLITNEIYQYCKNEIDDNMEIKRISNEKKMQSLDENEKAFIENLKSKIKEINADLEVDIDFKSGNIINFCVNGMQIGRVKLRGKKTSIQIITDTDVNWIENINLEEANLLSDKWIKYLKKHL